MANYTCDDNIVLFLANQTEGDITTEAPEQAVVPFGDVCAFGERWLLDLINEFCLRERWQMQAGIVAVTKDNLTEIMQVGIIGTPRFVAEERAKLDRFMQAANRWHRGEKRNNSIWLYSQFLGESGMRRCLVYNIRSRDFPTQYPKDNSKSALDMRLDIQRHFTWENIERDALDPYNNDYWTGIQEPRLLGAFDVFSEGTSPARIAILRLIDNIRNEITKRIIGRVWIGIKEDLGCGLDNWNPIMECELGDNGTDASNVAIIDPDISNNAYKLVDFTTDASVVRRTTITLGDAFPLLAKSDFEQWRGDYIVLLRAQQDATSTNTSISIRYGWKDGGRKIPVQQSPAVFTGETNWRLIGLGVISFPPDSGRQNISLISDPPAFPDTHNLSECSIDILIGRNSVAGEIRLDALFLIPYERHAIFQYRGAVSPSFASQAPNDDSLWFVTNEDDTQELRYITSDAGGFASDPIADYQLDTRDFFLPEKGSRIVYAVNAFDETGVAPNIVYKPINALSFSLTTRTALYPRWLTYRVQ